ncbi:MurR/RpiR family transcriptional regulator [Actibacterium sp. 188UL27-1]|uniref:MurR/RpiR family transcriptional regulator n=1 Tax=Actibacterium sp. 188UL27-1 TaxID=2786961 RepID=UPI00195671A2|nr:MurR/RpiR family transcriptional regulator [Actibacterium sp. 188UL27-1]MBM7067458.1 MurR/RpiR family transcriptional regulator [Actibacterium sp. 188UL27-1]
MGKGENTVFDQVQALHGDLTRAERQLADTILDNYPISGLGSITELAEQAGVSTPTVARMVQKIGYSGYPEFQAALRVELQAMVSNPVHKRERWGQDIPETHVLHRFAQAASENMYRTLDQIDPVEFDALCGIIIDPARRLHIAGGRISGTLAQYLFLHLQMIRPGVALVPTHSNVWPHYMLDIGAGDTLIAFDVRRYENSTLLMAEMAHERGAEIVLFTDQWRSPIHRVASHTFAARISVPSAWDSAMATMLLIECAIAAVQEGNWEAVKSRTDTLEASFDRTGLFRKFT